MFNSPVYSSNKELSPRKELLHNIDSLYDQRGKRLFPDEFDTRVRAALRVGDWKIITGNPGMFCFSFCMKVVYSQIISLSLLQPGLAYCNILSGLGLDGGDLVDSSAKARSFIFTTLLNISWVST